MSSEKEKLILTDADGVLLAWDYAFDCWLQQHGKKAVEGGMRHYCLKTRYGMGDNEAWELVKIFNESAAIGFLPPLRDAIHYVKKLHQEHGFVFKCITSLSSDSNAKKLREMNLSKLFGETVFTDVVCLETGADKDAELIKYKDSECYWIEDKPENAVTGHELGLTSLLMSHGYNWGFRHPEIRHVANWREIYDIIVG